MMSDPQKRPSRNPKVDEEIDRNLRRAFDAVAEEPLPDRFASLLNKLKNEDEGKGSNEPASLRDEEEDDSGD